MDSAITHQHFQLKKNTPELRAGDRVRVHQKIKEGNKERIQVFEGLIIKCQHGRGINGTFTVRRISLGVGVEKTFPLHLPTITKIEKLKSAKVRRSKLFYVRGLVGKKARRLKREKEDKAVWEDVIVEGDEPQNSNLKSQNKENQEEKSEMTEKESKEEETETKKETDKEPEKSKEQTEEKTQELEKEKE
jgi:large subunit ribosomal protein L19